MLPKELQKLEEEKDTTERQRLQEKVKEMQQSEEVYFEEMKNHIGNAIAALPSSPRETIKHLQRFGTTLLLTHQGEGELEKYAYHNNKNNFCNFQRTGTPSQPSKANR